MCVNARACVATGAERSEASGMPVAGRLLRITARNFLCHENFYLDLVSAPLSW